MGAAQNTMEDRLSVPNTPRNGSSAFLPPKKFMTEVTVLMTVFNGMPYLAEAVDSILCQTLCDFEFVIVDDGSTDGTSDYLDSIADPRVRIIRQDNGGTAAAANLGLENIDTHFVARMDADDISLPTRLSKQLSFMKQNPDVGILGTQVVPVGSAGHGKSLALPCTHQELFSDMMSCKHGLAHSSVMIDANRLKSIGGYWSLRLIDDWDMMLRMGEISRLANLDEVLVHYRVHAGSLNGTDMLRMQRSIAYAAELARRRQADMSAISYEAFVESLDNAPLFHRLAERARSFALAQYRIAVADQCGGRKIAGAVRLGFAALLSPRRTVDRIGRMMRFSKRRETAAQPQKAALTENSEVDPNAVVSQAVSTTPKRRAETETGSLS